MQNLLNQKRKQNRRYNNVKKEGRPIRVFFLVLFFIFTIVFQDISFGAEKKIKKQPVQREFGVTGSNIQASIGKAEEQLKKGDSDGALRTYIKIYDYTKEVLTTIGFVQTQYEKLVNDPAVNQEEKEDFFIKLSRIKQIRPKYSGIKTISAYNIGYIYTKKGDSDKARRYLSEVLETTPFSTKQGSLWMKSKILLLEVYGLEGEF